MRRKFSKPFLLLKRVRRNVFVLRYFGAMLMYASSFAKQSLAIYQASSYSFGFLQLLYMKPVPTVIFVLSLSLTRVSPALTSFLDKPLSVELVALCMVSFSYCLVWVRVMRSEFKSTGLSQPSAICNKQTDEKQQKKVFLSIQTSRNVNLVFA